MTISCNLCGTEADTDMMNHIRLMHPNVLDQMISREILSLKPVTQAMHDDDHVCESCDRQFVLGMVFGETFEGMFHGLPIVSLVCGDCFWREV